RLRRVVRADETLNIERCTLNVEPSIGIRNDALRRDQLAADREQAGSLRSPENDACLALHQFTIHESRCLLSLLLQCAFRLIDNRLESRVVGESEIGKNFAIETDASGFQSFGKTAVSHA